MVTPRHEPDATQLTGERQMLACGKWLAFIAVLLITASSIAAAQGVNAFDGTYVGASASNLGSMQRGSTSGGCRTFNAPSPPTIVNGRNQGKWGDGHLIDKWTLTGRCA